MPTLYGQADSLTVIPASYETEAVAREPIVTTGLDGSSRAAANWAADEVERRNLTLCLPYAWLVPVPEPKEPPRPWHGPPRAPGWWSSAGASTVLPWHRAWAPWKEPVSTTLCPVAVVPHD
jgi:hypothetical protein